MSKEVTVTPLCPNHAGRVVATVEHTITLNDRPPTVVDMCSECDSSITDRIVLFVEDGTPVEPIPPRRNGGTGRRPSAPSIPDDLCPECGRMDFASRGSRNSHIRSAHNKSIRDYT